MIECSYATMFDEEVKYTSTLSQGAAIRFIQGKKGVFDSISGIEEALTIPGIQEIEIYMSPGDEIKSPENSSDRIGHIIAIGENADAASDLAELAMSKITINMR